jgi:hypothetical protein
VLGYHGCDRSTGERLLRGASQFRKSDNDYDWLGRGVYFWEANPARAKQFAKEKKQRGDRIKEPFVLGAVIDLGLCLDLTTTDSVEYLRAAYKSLKTTTAADGSPLPVNGPRIWERSLDCAVIRRLHAIVADARQPPIDTVRGVFQEGEPMYDGSAFYEKTHIQIAVSKLDCIKAVFRVR